MTHRAVTAAVPEGEEPSAAFWGLLKLSAMYALPFSSPRETISARLHSSVHCSTSSLRGLRSVTLLQYQRDYQKE